jgi:hypothetical protein
MQYEAKMLYFIMREKQVFFKLKKKKRGERGGLVTLDKIYNRSINIIFYIKKKVF